MKASLPQPIAWAAPLLFAAISCSWVDHRSTRPAATESSAGAAAAPQLDPVGVAPAPARPGRHSGGLTASECEALIEHAVSLALAVHRDGLDPELIPTAQQLARIRRELGRELGPPCRAMERAAHACALAATDEAAWARCSATAGTQSPAR